LYTICIIVYWSNVFLVEQLGLTFGQCSCKLSSNGYRFVNQFLKISFLKIRKSSIFSVNVTRTRPSALVLRHLLMSIHRVHQHLVVQIMDTHWLSQNQSIQKHFQVVKLDPEWWEVTQRMALVIRRTTHTIIKRWVTQIMPNSQNSLKRK